MRVGILGSGLMGGKLGTIFARAGHEVVFSYARLSAVDAGNSLQYEDFPLGLALSSAG
jgi:predicted dinucleotide-binding enzyme